MTNTLEKLNLWIATLRGWRGKLACFIAGAATAAAFAPFYIWPILLLTIPFLFLMIEKARHWRSAALYSLAFGYGYYMAGTYWIANALAVDVEKFGWMIPLSILGLSLWFALWFALFGALVRVTKSENSFANMLRFAVLWVIVEYGHAFGLLGFPWNMLGNVTAASSRILQLDSLIGPYGLSLFIVWLALTPLLWIKSDIASKLRHRALVVALLMLIGSYSFGMIRMPAEAGLGETRVRVVQGNIAQSLKWSDEGRDESARIYGSLTRMQTETPIPPIVVWPETALPFTLREFSPWTEQLSQILEPGGVLLTGAMRSEGEDNDYRLYNSIIAFDAYGKRHDVFDKHQLVPLGEFVPLRTVLPLEKITPGGVDFSRGPGPKTVKLDGIPSFSPLICYEVIFPGIAVDSKNRPEWIVNVTNDAWYGNSPGPYQHFDMARMRAVEQGLPLVRAANTGISAVIDPYGRVLKSLPLNERGIIDQALPKPLRPTLYSRLGDLPTLLLLLIIWFYTGRIIFQRKK